MNLFSVLVEYTNGDIEDLTAADGSTAHDLYNTLETFMNESIPGTWEKITILNDGTENAPIATPQGFALGL